MEPTTYQIAYKISYLQSRFQLLLPLVNIENDEPADVEPFHGKNLRRDGGGGGGGGGGGLSGVRSI